MRVPTRLLLALGAVLMVVLLGGCMVARPPGDGTLRYRDVVFASPPTKTPDLTYGSATSRDTGQPVALKLDMFRPAGDTQTKRPAMVWVHGGGFVAGDKSDNYVPQEFARRGYVAVSINYRLSQQPPCTSSNLTPACVQTVLDAQHDAQAAVRWLRANATAYGIDPTRIGIAGSSAGAITATAVGLHSEDVGDSGSPAYSSKVGAFSSFSGGLPSGLYASSGDAPGVLLHGTADPTVPYQWSADTAAKLLQAGVAAYLEPLDGQGHTPSSAVPQLVEQTDYLFYTFMDLAHAAGQPPAAAKAFSSEASAAAKRYPRFARTMRRAQRLHSFADDR